MFPSFVHSLGQTVLQDFTKCDRDRLRDILHIKIYFTIVIRTQCNNSKISKKDILYIDASGMQNLALHVQRQVSKNIFKEL
jgi:hypothetical protein